MNKGKAIYILRKCGDGIVDFKGEKEAILATIDFNNPHIKKRRNFKRYTLEQGTVLLFDWTNNEFLMVEADMITHITPLSNILKNEREEEDNGETK